jgi:tetratricopeptide (TPR) repeat protein
LRGRAIRHSYTEHSLAEAFEHFQKAIELDQNFAAAHSGLADIYATLGIVAMKPAQAFRMAKEHAEKAVALDANLAAAYASLAFATWGYDWDSIKSERLFKKSFAFDANHAPAHEWFAVVLASEGRFDEAIREIHRALEIDPKSPQHNSVAGFIYYNARRFDEGVAYVERAVELDPQNYIALQAIGWIYPPIGRAFEAIPFCQKAVELSNRTRLCLWSLAQVFAEFGASDEAKKLIAELEEMEERDNVSPYHMAMLWTAIGDFDKALDYLKKVPERDYWAGHWLEFEHRFDPLRSDVRFAEFVRGIKNF